MCTLTQVNSRSNCKKGSLSSVSVTSHHAQCRLRRVQRGASGSYLRNYCSSNRIKILTSARSRGTLFLPTRYTREGKLKKIFLLLFFLIATWFPQQRYDGGSLSLWRWNKIFALRVSRSVSHVAIYITRIPCSLSRATTQGRFAAVLQRRNAESSGLFESLGLSFRVCLRDTITLYLPFRAQSRKPWINISHDCHSRYYCCAHSANVMLKNSSLNHPELPQRNSPHARIYYIYI